MRTDRLLRKNITSALDIRANYPKGHLNGLMVSFNVHSLFAPGGSGQIYSNLSALHQLFNSTMVKVKYYNSKTSDILVSNIPLRNFAYISDLQAGSTGYSELEDLLFVQINDDTPVSEVTALFESLAIRKVFTVYPHLNVYIDLGSIICDNGDEISIELTSDSPNVANFNAGELSIYAVSKELDPFNLFFYDVDYDLNELHDQVTDSWVVFDRNGIDTDFEIEVRSTNENYSTDRTGLRAVSNVFNKIENKSLEYLLPVFEGSEGLPENAYIKLTARNGRSLSNIAIMNKRVSSDLDKYFSQRLNFERRLEAVLEKATSSEKTSGLVQVIAAESAK